MNDSRLHFENDDDLENFNRSKEVQRDYEYISFVLKRADEVGLRQEVEDTAKEYLKANKDLKLSDEDFKIIKDQFPNSRIETIPGTGHWLHAEEPDIFYDMVMSFLKE